MRPGLSRGIPMGILGFLVGMIILVAIRGLQGLQPLMDPQLAIVLGAFTAAGFFIWGMGAFDPRMNEHAHEPVESEDAHALAVAEEAEAEETPPQIVSGYMWMLSTALIVLLLLIVAFALLPGGPSLQVASQPTANVSAIGYVQIDLMGQTYMVSQLVLLLGFVVIMFGTMALLAGGLGGLFFVLNQGVTRVQTVEQTTLAAEPLEKQAASNQGLVRWGVIGAVAIAAFAVLDLLLGTPITNEIATLSFFVAAAGVFVFSFIILGYFIRLVAARTGWPWLVRAIVILAGVGLVLNVADFLLIWFGLTGLLLVPAIAVNITLLVVLLISRQVVAIAFMVLAGILMPLFYFVLIGLVIAFEPPLLFGISAGNALVIAALILRPRFVTHWLGYGAAWTAKQLRRLPDALQ
jgi:hypothetical protein